MEQDMRGRIMRRTKLSSEMTNRTGRGRARGKTARWESITRPADFPNSRADTDTVVGIGDRRHMTIMPGYAGDDAVTEQDRMRKPERTEEERALRKQAERMKWVEEVKAARRSEMR